MINATRKGNLVLRGPLLRGILPTVYMRGGAQEGHWGRASQGKREIPKLSWKLRATQAVQGAGGRAPGHTFRLEWNCWNPRRITEGGRGSAALHNLQDLNPDQGLKPEPQQWRPRNPESWMPTTRPTGSSPTESFMRTSVRYGWMNCTRESSSPTVFLPPFMAKHRPENLPMINQENLFHC